MFCFRPCPTLSPKIGAVSILIYVENWTNTGLWLKLMGMVGDKFERHSLWEKMLFHTVTKNYSFHAT